MNCEQVKIISHEVKDAVLYVSFSVADYTNTFSSDDGIDFYKPRVSVLDGITQEVLDVCDCDAQYDAFRQIQTCIEKFAQSVGFRNEKKYYAKYAD